MTDPGHNRGARRSASRRLNVATRHEERFEDIDVPMWLLKPKQPATRLEVYSLLRKYDIQRRRREMPLWKKILLALWYVVMSPIRIPWRWIRRAWARRHQVEDSPEQEQDEA